MAKSKASQTAVWILLGLLILGLGGFGVTNFGGSVRSIGEVNGQTLSTNAYFRALRQDMNALSAQVGRQVSFAEAQGFGLEGSTRSRLVTTAMLDAEVARLGLSVGDERLAAEIRAMAPFRSAGGAFDRNLYRLALEQNAWTEAEFEATTRADIARSLMQASVAGGLVGSEAMGRTVFEWLEERRSFSLLRLTEADLSSPLPSPDDATLRQHHADNPQAFTRPEARRITYAALLPQDVMDEITVNEDELRASYQARLTEFVQPERRLVERLVFGTEEQAENARNRLDASLISFEDLVTERGLSLDDIDLGDVAAADLGAAAEVVFAMDEPGVVGPLPSDLGPALFRMNGILEAQEVTFDEAREQLLAEFGQDAARRLIADRVEEIDDLLAGGATLEDLGQDAGLRVETIDMIPGLTEGMAAYPEFRTRAAAARDRDFPEVVVMQDGGLFALRLDAVLPPELRPYEEVTDAVEADWRATTLRAALATQLDSAKAAVEGGAALGTQGVTEVYARMPREGRVDQAPPDLMAQVFALEPGALTPIVAGEFTALLRLDEIHTTEGDAAEADAFIDLFAQQLGQQMGTDAFELLTRALEARSTIRLDQAAIEAVHAQMR
jgi:peptidyl-prolyl cis-trans isomerase D